METIAARVSYFPVKHVIEVKEEKFETDPTPIYQLILDALKLNYTLIESPENEGIGDYSEQLGGYDGIYGQLQNNKSDFSMITSPINVFTSSHEMPVLVGPVFTQFDSIIASCPPKSDPVMSKVHVLYSLASIDWSIALMYILFFIFTFKLMNRFSIILAFAERRKSKRKSKSVGWHMTRVCCNQHDCTPAFSSQKLLFLTFVLGIFWLHFYYNGFFSAEQIVETKKKMIDTLEDLLETKMYPIFYKTLPDYLSFKQSSNPIYKKVWERVEKEGTNSTLVTSEPDTVFNILEKVKDRKAVQITQEAAITIVHPIMCAKDPNVEIYSSKEKYLNIVYVYIFSPKISLRLKQRFIVVLTDALEMGFSDHFQRTHGQSLDDLLLPDVIVKECMRRVRGHVEEVIPDVLNLRLDNISYLLMSLICLHLVAFLLLTIEVIVDKVRQKHNTLKSTRARVTFVTPFSY